MYILGKSKFEFRELRIFFSNQENIREKRDIKSNTLFLLNHKEDFREQVASLFLSAVHLRAQQHAAG